MSKEEKIQLNRDRQKAVRDAWNREKEFVSKRYMEVIHL